MMLYKITNKINGKSYIGQTEKRTSKRWKQHIAQSVKGSSAFSKAIREFGKEAFVVETIGFYRDLEMINRFECYFIKEYQTLIPMGYNSTTGGKGKTKIVRTTPPWNKGKTYSLEFRAKLSEAHKGIPNVRAKLIYGQNLETGEAWFFRSSTVALKHGFEPALIRRCCRGETKTHKGVKWSYYE